MLGGVRPVGHGLFRFPVARGGWVRGGRGLPLLAVLVGGGTVTGAWEWAVSVVTLAA